MDFPYELICHRYVLNSFYFSKLLNNEYAVLDPRYDSSVSAYNFNAFNETINMFVSEYGKDKHFFPLNFYIDTTIMWFLGIPISTIKPEFMIIAMQMIIMDFINFICIYGPEIVVPVFRGTDRGLIFDKAVGERIHNQNLVSTSMNLDTAKSFGDKVIIIASNGNKGLVVTKPLVSSTGDTINEYEVIFPPCMSTKIRENFQQDKLYTEITYQNSPPPVIDQSRYKVWFRGNELAWDYYKKHSYFADLYARYDLEASSQAGHASVNGGSVKTKKRKNKKRKGKGKTKRNKV